MIQPKYIQKQTQLFLREETRNKKSGDASLVPKNNKGKNQRKNRF